MDWRQGFWPKRAFYAPRIHKIGLIRHLSGLAARYGCSSVQQGAQQTMIVKNLEIERLIRSGAGTSANNQPSHLGNAADKDREERNASKGDDGC